ncbi:MAG: RagB/SusD family nutrient uptake outer membrane protein [Gemmatimonadaceae bacterium]
MQYHNSNRSGRKTSGRGVVKSILILGLAVITACTSLLDVTNPGVVKSSDLSDPALAPTLDAAALGTFNCAFAQYVATAGVLSGEYVVSNSFVDANQWGWRGVETKTQPGTCPGSRATTSLGFYTPMQSARFQAEDAARRITAFTAADVPNRANMLAELTTYAAYSYVLLGEGMCQMTVDNGPLITRDSTFKIAVAKFTQALTLAQAANYAAMTNMALVGRARASLDLGNLDAAKADAQAVPAGFVRNADYSETTVSRENRIYNLTIRNDFLSVGPDYRNLTVHGVADPRVPVLNTGRFGNDAVTPQWQQRKYTTSGAVPMPIASWAEAQLIYAEAAGGQDAKDAINRVRASRGVAPLDGTEGSDIEAIVLEERRRELFSEGQRLGDMLRKNIPFPSGVNHKGQTYGPTTCAPLPDVETQNNPNLRGS